MLGVSSCFPFLTLSSCLDGQKQMAATVPVETKGRMVNFECGVKFLDTLSPLEETVKRFMALPGEEYRRSVILQMFSAAMEDETRIPAPRPPASVEAIQMAFARRIRMCSIVYHGMAPNRVLIVGALRRAGTESLSAAPSFMSTTLTDADLRTFAGSWVDTVPGHRWHCAICDKELTATGPTAVRVMAYGLRDRTVFMGGVCAANSKCLGDYVKLITSRLAVPDSSPLDVCDFLIPQLSMTTRTEESP
jgi:hypothetical protein